MWFALFIQGIDVLLVFIDDLFGKEQINRICLKCTSEIFITNSSLLLSSSENDIVVEAGRAT